MNAAFVARECKSEQHEHYDQDDALFALREIENPEQALHRSVTQLSLPSSGTPLFFIRLSAGCHSERSEESQLFLCTDPPSQQPEMFRFAQHDKNGLFRVTNGIFYSGFTETFESQKTRIAFAASETLWRRIITAVGERKIDTELDCFPNDFGF